VLAAPAYRARSQPDACYRRLLLRLERRRRCSPPFHAWGDSLGQLVSFVAGGSRRPHGDEDWQRRGSSFAGKMSEARPPPPPPSAPPGGGRRPRRPASPGPAAAATRVDPIGGADDVDGISVASSASDGRGGGSERRQRSLSFDDLYSLAPVQVSSAARPPPSCAVASEPHRCAALTPLSMSRAQGGFNGESKFAFIPLDGDPTVGVKRSASQDDLQALAEVAAPARLSAPVPLLRARAARRDPRAPGGRRRSSRSIITQPPRQSPTSPTTSPSAPPL